LFVPTSVGLSKLGDAKNRTKEVVVSDVTIVNRAESEPELIVLVTDSEIEMVATFEAVTLFSAIEKDVPFVKVGAVVSGV
jgi:hypothetical protein